MNGEHNHDHDHDEAGNHRDLQEIEQLLRQVPLRAPRAGLDARVMRACRRRGWFGGASGRLRVAVGSAAAAAMVAGAIWATAHFGGWPRTERTVVQKETTPTPAIAIKTAPPSPRPVGLVRTVSNVTDEGIIGTAGGMPVQRYRRQSVQQVVLVDPVRRTRVAFTVPREEIFVVRMRPF